ncbi:TetR/AcrR family transcriptional regulator [Burkholderia multivorans]|uniref:TetR/AcrR family transcriptional regulator n=1 Tax=Burkholderia multivorans TaxID=87883 RepID=UPI001E6351AD|nr:TetR/AcrR family transcriptional regulator [Burkholderia multivorans]
MEAHHILIREESVRLFKERGFNGVSVADIMSSVGLTHGGFYGHFDSKDELAGVACGHAFEESFEKWSQLGVGELPERVAMARLADHYLSVAQRDTIGEGCPITSLATDVTREPADATVRATYISGVKRLFKLLCAMPKRRQSNAVREQAMVRLATMVGALTLARALKGDELSEEILVAARKHLKRDACGPVRSTS